MSEPLTQIELPVHLSPQTGSPTGQISKASQPTTSSLTVALPPFRSVTEFPRAPKPEQLPALYADCLQVLQQANTARLIHKRRMEARKKVISAVRLEIARIEQDLALEASTRARLHSMNLRLFSALQEMDSLVGDLDVLVHEAHRVPRSRLGRLIDRLKALIYQWRSLKRQQREEMAALIRTEQDGEP